MNCEFIYAWFLKSHHGQLFVGHKLVQHIRRQMLIINNGLIEWHAPRGAVLMQIVQGEKQRIKIGGQEETAIGIGHIVDEPAARLFGKV